jgi:hypothetical protein
MAYVIDNITGSKYPFNLDEDIFNNIKHDNWTIVIEESDMEKTRNDNIDLMNKLEEIFND